MTYQIQNMKLTFLIPSSCKNHTIQTYYSQGKSKIGFHFLHSLHKYKKDLFFEDPIETTSQQTILSNKYALFGNLGYTTCEELF